VKDSATTVPLPKVPPAILTSTRRALDGKVGSSTFMNPAPPVTVAVGADGTDSVFVVTNLPGDQSLTVPSEYTH